MGLLADQREQHMTAADTRVVMALVVLVVVARGADRGGDGGGHGADPLVNGTLRATNDVTSGVSWRQMAGCDQAFRGGNRGFVGRAYRIRTQYRPPSKAPGQRHIPEGPIKVRATIRAINAILSA